MRIVHVVRQFYPSIGGLENFVYCLCREQLRQGHNIWVITLNKIFCDNQTVPEFEMHENIPIFRLGFRGSKKYPIALSAIKYLKDCDVVHIHGVDFFVDYLVLMKVIHRKRIVLHTHGGFFHTKWMHFLKVFYFNVITRLVLLGCDSVIACSSNDFELFSKVFGRVIRIDNGVDVEKYIKLKKNIEYGNMLYVGRLDIHKRIDNLIKTTAELIKDGCKVRLTILGPDWKGLTPALKVLANELGVQDSVTFLGQVGEAQLLFEIARAHIFVSASEYEGFGISAVETMASGTVCVLNDMRSFRQFVQHGMSGMLVDFNDPKKGRDTILNVLKLDKVEFSAMGERAKEVAQQYNWNIVADKIESVYKKVIKK